MRITHNQKCHTMERCPDGKMSAMVQGMIQGVPGVRHNAQEGRLLRPVGIGASWNKGGALGGWLAECLESRYDGSQGVVREVSLVSILGTSEIQEPATCKGLPPMTPKLNVFFLNFG